MTALRKTYFFGDDAPSIIFYKDIIHLLPKYTSSNHQALARAVELCNLATFAYIILNPDYAGRLAPGSKPSRKGKERARDPSMVEKRNSVLLNIWEKYWQIIPESEKASEEAMRMWLALATQVRLPTPFRCPTDPRLSFTTSPSKSIPHLCPIRV